MSMSVLLCVSVSLCVSKKEKVCLIVHFCGQGGWTILHVLLDSNVTDLVIDVTDLVIDMTDLVIDVTDLVIDMDTYNIVFKCYTLKRYS